MPTISEQLTQLASIKSDIKDAIEAKGETVGSDAFSTYATHIGNISSGGGSVNAPTVFYDCSTTPPGAKGGKPPVEPGISVTLYVQYDNNNDKIPDMFIVYDEDGTFTAGTLNYIILSQSQPINDAYYSSSAGNNISITSLTSTVATLQYKSIVSYSIDPSKFQFAPIYLS